jgi:hypothetical protein
MDPEYNYKINDAFVRDRNNPMPSDQQILFLQRTKRWVEPGEGYKAREILGAGSEGMCVKFGRVGRPRTTQLHGLIPANAQPPKYFVIK